MAESTYRPVSFGEATREQLAGVKGICLDIDETLSTRGKLTAEAYSALWRAKDAGLYVVPITGRPAGWCDQIARFWPVDGVVGENGAFTFYMEGGLRRRIDTPHPGATTAEARAARLRGLGDKVRARFPWAKWASDQSYREYDLAIDICEDVPAWKPADVEALLELCHAEGAHAKLSSIHVNAWFGDYDKKSGFDHFLASRGAGWPDRDEWLFIGDSPNDEPMFKHFRDSVGVANLVQYLERLKSPPRWITRAESGAGFAEMVAGVLDARKGANG